MTPDHEATLTAEHGPYDLQATLRWLPLGRRDPTWSTDGAAVLHACRTASGPVTARLAPRRDGVKVQLWGQGTEAVRPGLRGWLGLDDRIDTFAPEHPWVAAAWARHRGARLIRSPDPIEALWVCILQQRVTYAEAARGWRSLVLIHGEAAPGPGGLRVAPDPSVVSRIPPERWHPWGVEAKRARTMAEVAARASRIREKVDDDPVAARRWLGRLPGIGPWTLGMVYGNYLGDADAVPVRDVHLPHTVAWALRRKPRSDDAEMLRLLARFRPHRQRVLRLLLHDGIKAPKRGPKKPNRWAPGS